jgi:methylmalonyl-CoA mutase N-terminal domain/subunit
MRLITDVFEWCSAELPKWNTISISGYHMREAGATAAQELAFTFADAIAYVDAAIARGMEVDAIGPRLSFFFAAWTDILEETAKFRAARRIWARLMRERFGAKSEKSLHCRFHVQTAGSALTAQSIDNNVVRAAYQALAAVLGGAQSLHVNGKDEALALPTEASARLALRTQQVLAHEAGVAGTVDPLGGSYAVEALTDQVERDALALIAEVDRLGGMVAAVAASVGAAGSRRRKLPSSSRHATITSAGTSPARNMSRIGTRATTATMISGTDGASSTPSALALVTSPMPRRSG